MTLSPNRIEELANLPGVRRIAVENFLSSLDGLSYQEAKGNLELDRSAYKWNDATYGAIWTGLLEAFKGA